MKNKKRTILIALLAMMMIATIAMSWVFWSAGIGGDDDDGLFNIRIGDAGQISTTLTAQDIAGTPGNLIPHDVTPRADDEVNSIRGVFEVTWAATNAADNSYMIGEASNLTAEVSSIEIGGVNFEHLFNVSFDVVGANDINYVGGTPLGSGTDIYGYIGASAVYVRVTITMNRPADRDEFLAVRNQIANFTFTFSVEDIDFIS